ncbi:hydrolase [Alkalimonas mucilaginosa]|uniref:Hydrolase n=1 Tax=Alkalimonas mucilaginosa TaxID=3057676 RepID=A0ABU7JJU4_9GAMM|nr:hydrolase [Alkalimonas sp. MEB004]MEE2025959.1 hydrolase [Alkalimonas sp. MEB004]
MLTTVPFKAAWWLPGGHLQTLAAKYLHPRYHGALITEWLPLTDGDELELCWSQTLTADYQGPLVVLLHGLAGSKHSHYVQGMFAAFAHLDWPVVLMHFRGCGSRPNQLPRAYHSGDTEDLRYLLTQIQQRHPGARLLAAGFSLGGNVLMKYCGEQQQQNPLRAAVAVCAPLALASSAKRINQGFSKLYQRYLLRQLKQSALHKLQHFADFPIPLTHQAVKRMRSIEAFDDGFTAPLHGFLNAADYYQRASGRQFLPAIQVPSLIIHAANDPFLAADVVPSQDELSDLVLHEQWPSGGHVGFVAGRNPFKPLFWLNERIPLFFQEVLQR